MIYVLDKIEKQTRLAINMAKTEIITKNTQNEIKIDNKLIEKVTKTIKLKEKIRKTTKSIKSKFKNNFNIIHLIRRNKWNESLISIKTNTSKYSLIYIQSMMKKLRKHIRIR